MRTTDERDTRYDVAKQSSGVELFLDLSVALTGFSKIELWGTGMVRTYYDEVNLIIGEREMGKLLSVSSKNIPHGNPITPAVEADVEKYILDDNRYGPVGRNIIRLWYLGAWSQLPQEWRNSYGATSYDNDHIVSAQAYKQSLVWFAGEAHPMGAKQQGFGAWAMPGPEPEPPAEHHCQEHGIRFKRYSRGNSIWYAHKDGDKWCREKRLSEKRLLSSCAGELLCVDKSVGAVLN